ncbi:MAG: porin [Alphaproteobacteria bacterium]
MTKSRGGRCAAWTRALLVGTVLSGAIVAVPMSGAKADTQSEIDALKAENAALREMIQNLSQDVQILQKSVNQATETATKAMESPKKPEKMVQSGRDIQVTVSGQANRMLFYADDGDQSQIFNADNKTSTSRLNVTGKGKINDDLTAGATLEVELRSNDTSRVTMSQETEQTAGVSFTERKAEIFLQSASLGTLWLGQGPQAADGVTENDLSGTSVISASSLGQDQGAALMFRREGTNVSSGRTVGNLFNNFDVSRRDRIRYDTPDLAGFVGSISYSDFDIYDYALRYGGDFEGWKAVAAIGYTDMENQPTPSNNLNMSAAIRAPFGTSLQGAYATQEVDVTGRNDADLWWIKLGHEFADLLPFGSTAFSIDYAETSDQAVNESEGSWWSFAAVQNIKKASTELYFNIGQYSVDLPNIPTEDILIAGLGARVRF